MRIDSAVDRAARLDALKDDTAVGVVDAVEHAPFAGVHAMPAFGPVAQNAMRGAVGIVDDLDQSFREISADCRRKNGAGQP